MPSSKHTAVSRTKGLRSDQVHTSFGDTQTQATPTGGLEVWVSHNTPPSGRISPHRLTRATSHRNPTTTSSHRPTASKDGIGLLRELDALVLAGAPAELIATTPCGRTPSPTCCVPPCEPRSPQQRSNLCGFLLLISVGRCRTAGSLLDAQVDGRCRAPGSIDPLC